MTNRIFWVKVSGAGVLKFDYDELHTSQSWTSPQYGTYEEYFRNFIGGWEDGNGNPVRSQYVIQDAEPDETTQWLDGPLSGSLH
jgi:hypothetical protein